VFERFTERARRVVVLALEEAQLLKHSYIGTEHILLGLLREEEGLAAAVLANLGIKINQTRAQVVRIVGSGEEVASGQVPFTPRAKKVLDLALREALGLGHNFIGTEHILLGLVRENEGVAARVLLDFDADPEKIQIEVIRMRMLSERGSAHSEPVTPEGSLPEPASGTRLQTPEVSDCEPGERPAFSWRSRPIALAALGAAIMSRRAFELQAPDDLEPLALQILVAVALSQPAGGGGPAQSTCDLPALRAVLCCDDEELETAIAVLLTAELIGTQETHARFDPAVDEQRFTLTERGSVLVEAWLSRIAPLFGAWPPSDPGVDDAH
jgi:hypothetical protein